MLVFEGSDNLGKTTAARRLIHLCRTSLGIPMLYGHMGRQYETFSFDRAVYKRWIRPYFLCDRFHLGMRVWHKDDEIRSLEATSELVQADVVSDGGMVVIFVTRDEEWYINHLRTSKKDEMFNVAALVQANRVYQHLAARFAHHLVVVEEGSFPGDETLLLIAREYHRRLRRSGYLS